VAKSARLAGAKGDSYQYTHDDPDALGKQEYLGVEKSYYQPTDRGHEKLLAEHLRAARAARKTAIDPP
jgi:putative ATPase